jgi:hypothetical protein
MQFSDTQLTPITSRLDYDITLQEHHHQEQQQQQQ